MFFRGAWYARAAGCSRFAQGDSPQAAMEAALREAASDLF